MRRLFSGVGEQALRLTFLVQNRPFVQAFVLLTFSSRKVFSWVGGSWAFDPPANADQMRLTGSGSGFPVPTSLPDYLPLFGAISCFLTKVIFPTGRFLAFHHLVFNLSAMDTVLLVSCNKIQFFPFLKAKKSIRWKKIRSSLSASLLSLFVTVPVCTAALIG
jgi:hypothetical protein